MPNLYFTICAFFIGVLIAIMFFTKKNVKNKETETYKFMILSGLVDSICMGIVIFTAYKSPNKIQIMDFFNRIDFVAYVIWAYSLLKYTYFITYGTEKKQTNKVLNKILTTITIIAILLVLILPMNIYTANNAMYADGPAVIATYAMCAIYGILFILILAINAKKLASKKYIPLLALILLAIIALIVNRLNPTLLIIPAILQYINLIMYFTIENPDVKLLSKIELAKTQAEKANAAKTDFLSSMSHEIRTPLNAIVGFSESITEAETLEEAKENAKDILTASQNLLEIVNGILDISKIEANKMEIVNTEYDLKEEVEKLVKLIKPRIGEKPIEFKYYIAPDIPGKLYGDKGKIKEIMTNILTNAVKYTKEGYIELKVSCINKDNESSIVISVEDTGRGIKPENIDKLFTKFERLNEDRNTTIEGAGLGLAITKKLVEMMGGKIIVQSVYGSGSNFTVYLKQRIITRTSVSFDTSNQDGELNLIGKSVLVVDDNVLNIKVAEKLLKKYSINVDSCETGYECIEKIKQGKHYDLILMDDMMPKMTGTETLHILQEMPSFKDKTVVLTANAIEGMKEKYIEEGFDDYLAKPIEKYELERVLRKYLKKEKEHIEFEPIPDSFYDISDTIVEKLNAEEIIKSDQKNKTQ